MSRLRIHWPVVVYGIIVLLILAPVLLHPGYLFLLDMAWGPHTFDHLRPDSSYIILTALKGLGYLIPLDLLQKLLLTLILWGIGMGGWCLGRRYLSESWAFMAGLIYLLNPFVVERLLAGQWLVLAGYAYLPFVLALLLSWLDRPARRRWLRFVLCFALFPWISLHFTYLAGLLGALIGATFYLTKRPKLNVEKIAAWALLLPAGALALNAFWIYGHGGTSDILRLSDFQVFRTASDPQVGVWLNTLNLYGFWNSDYFLPKDFIPGWWLVGIVLAGLSAVGGYVSWRARSWLGIALAVAAPVAWYLAIGESSGLSRQLTEWLAAHLPGYLGLRDTAKWLGVLALSYAVLVPLGGEFITKTIGSKIKTKPGHLELLPVAALGLVVALAVLPFFNAANGQLRPARYPGSWDKADRLLAQTPHAKILALPWRGYLKVGFAGDHFVANPAHAAFGGEVVASTRTDNIRYDAARLTAEDSEVDALLAGRLTPDDFVARLHDRGFTDVAVLLTDDGSRYLELLSRSKNLRPVVSGELVLFALD